MANASAGSRLAVVMLSRYPSPELRPRPLSKDRSDHREYGGQLGAGASGTRVTLAYVVIGGVNATPRHAEELGRLLAGTRVKLNLIDVTDDTGRYRPATPEELGVFRDALVALGVPVVRRYSGGAEIAAACGTLAAERRGNVLIAPLPIYGRA